MSGKPLRGHTQHCQQGTRSQGAYPYVNQHRSTPALCALLSARPLFDPFADDTQALFSSQKLTFSPFTMSSNKTFISVNDIPHFYGKNYQQWASKIEGIFLITSTNALTTDTEPVKPTMPANNATVSNGRFMPPSSSQGIYKTRHTHTGEDHNTRM
jgi:hypothetical protein